MNFHTDINTGNEGLFWLSEIKKRCPDVEVVLFTAYADIALAVEGMKRGAFDFIVKPWDNEKLVDTLKAAYDGRNKDWALSWCCRKFISTARQKALRDKSRL